MSPEEMNTERNISSRHTCGRCCIGEVTIRHLQAAAGSSFSSGKPTDR